MYGYMYVCMLPMCNAMSSVISIANDFLRENRTDFRCHARGKNTAHNANNNHVPRDGGQYPVGTRQIIRVFFLSSYFLFYL